MGIHYVKSVQIRSFFWSVFSCIRTEYGEIRSISSHSVQMRENTDQNHSEYGHFLRSDSHHIEATLPAFNCSKVTIETPEKYMKSVRN